MSKFICQSCPERCSLFCAQNTSETPTRCQYTGKANWERVVEEKPPVYYTLPAPVAESEIDYKKAFEMMYGMVLRTGFDCSDCGVDCLDGRISCNEKVKDYILGECTKGGG